MAYLHAMIPTICGVEGCMKKATHELRSYRNETINEYCHQHAKLYLIELKSIEASNGLTS